MESEELKKAISDSVAEAVTPIVERLNQLEKEGAPDKKDQKKTEVSASVTAYLDDKKNNPVVGKPLNGTSPKQQNNNNLTGKGL